MEVVPTYDWASFFTPGNFHRSRSPITLVQQRSSKPATNDSGRDASSPRVCHFSGSGTYMTRSRSESPVADQDITCPEPSAPHQLHDRHQTPEPTSPSHPSIHPLPRGPDAVDSVPQQEELHWGLFYQLANHPNKTVLLRATNWNRPIKLNSYDWLSARKVRFSQSLSLCNVSLCVYGVCVCTLWKDRTFRFCVWSTVPPWRELELM